MVIFRHQPLYPRRRFTGTHWTAGWLGSWLLRKQQTILWDLAARSPLPWLITPHLTKTYGETEVYLHGFLTSAADGLEQTALFPLKISRCPPKRWGRQAVVKSRHCVVSRIEPLICLYDLNTWAPQGERKMNERCSDSKTGIWKHVPNGDRVSLETRDSIDIAMLL